MCIIDKNITKIIINDIEYNMNISCERDKAIAILANLETSEIPHEIFEVVHYMGKSDE